MPEGKAFWIDQHPPLKLPALAQDLEVDVAIVGAGMVGLHCALALRKSGLRVAIFEAREIGGQATGKSTAKITSQHGIRYAQLIRDFGEELARLYAEVNEEALESICALCAELEDHAALQRCDAFLYARTNSEAAFLEEEAHALASLGRHASVEAASFRPFDFHVEKLLRFRNQAQFDPVAYLRGIVGLLPPEMRVFEHSRVTEVKDGDRVTLTVNGHRVTAGRAVIATQIPVIPEGKFFAKAFPFAHPVAAAPLKAEIAIDGMFKSVGDPSHSFRTAEHDGHRYLIAAGPEFKPGDPDAQQEAVAELRRFLREGFDIAESTHLWINEDFRAMDSAPFIGRATRATPKLLVATGFNAWGITQGAVAGEILAAIVQEKTHTAAALFDATRLKPLSGGTTFLKENMHAGAKLVSDKFSSGSDVLDKIKPGGAGVVSRDGEQLAVRRQQDGTLHVLSAVCTHMGCLVGWNEIDRTWDCACHGSRFDEDGTVLSGPATTPLESREIGAEDGKG